MEIPVLLEPTAKGFRASTQSPVTLAAEGNTESAAMAALTSALHGGLPIGVKICTLTYQNTETVLEICVRMRANPLHREFEKAIQDYRKVANAVEDAD